VRYELVFDERFEGDTLDLTRWLPYYLPHWSSRELSAARYEIGDGELRLLIEEDQAPWSPELDGDLRVSSLQTGEFAGRLGSADGQHRFDAAAVVREEQPNVRLYTPQYGRIEIRCKAIDDPRSMVALWMIGYDGGRRSGEICVCELFGRELGPDFLTVGVGVHPFGDPDIVDDFSKVRVEADPHEFHVYTAEWTPDAVAFLVDGEEIKVVDQSPSYPMQLMLNIYEFPAEGDEPRGAYPKTFVVDYVRGYRLAG
jgi:Glycosyl hydrolases family 16